MKLKLLGKKIGMTQVFTEKGEWIPVTVIQAGPCPIVQIKTQKRDGYSALQVAFESINVKKVNKPLVGHFNKTDVGPHRYLREIRLKKDTERQVGDKFTVEDLILDTKIAVTGTVKGRGFAGVMKRHNFKGHCDSHGQERHRAPGSIGCSAWPAKVLKGIRMAGHMGTNKVTTKNLEIVKIDTEQNLVLVKGSVPGHNNGLVIVQQ